MSPGMVSTPLLLPRATLVLQLNQVSSQATSHGDLGDYETTVTAPYHEENAAGISIVYRELQLLLLFSYLKQ